MRELYLAADDLTGALDTGVQFAEKGVSVAVFPAPAGEEELRAAEVSVLVENLNTRHMDPEEAYRTVYAAVKRAKDEGFTRFYKKTDSALRGNVAEELSAMLEASGEETMEFAPAFPAQGRTTRNGIQYIGNVPVADSDLAHDPFNPIVCSSVKELVESRSERSCCLFPAGETGKTEQGTIDIYDGAEERDLIAVGRKLKQEGRLRCLAGCAGFAAVLPDLIPFETMPPEKDVLERPLFIVCGSIHPAAVRQIKAAEENGFVRLTLDEAQRLDISLVPGEKKRALIQANKEGRSVILDVYTGSTDIRSCCRQAVSDNLALLAGELFDAGVRATLLATGGDTLMSVLRMFGCRCIRNMREIAPGVVLASYECDHGTYHIVSKAGSFGNDDLFIQVERYICSDKEVGQI